MNITALLTGGVNKVIDSLGDAIDKLVTSDEEKLILKNAMLDARMKALETAENQALEMEREITKRWESDLVLLFGLMLCFLSLWWLMVT